MGADERIKPISRYHCSCGSLLRLRLRRVARLGHRSGADQGFRECGVRAGTDAFVDLATTIRCGDDGNEVAAMFAVGQTMAHRTVALALL